MKKYTPTSGISPEGYPAIGLCAFTALFCALLGWSFFAFFFLLLLFFICHFFRDPERVIPQDDACAVSPADGKIIRISDKPDPFTGEHRQCIAIFMNVLSVHVNRTPTAGQISRIKYFPGAFFNAALAKASEDNERCAYQIRDTEGNMWTTVQIAGLIARRIVCGVSPGVSLERGERFGMIKFGSRLELYLPPNYKPTVAIGDNVYAGQSIIAQYNETQK